jgi:hypothetical protein
MGYDSPGLNIVSSFAIWITFIASASTRKPVFIRRSIHYLKPLTGINERITNYYNHRHYSGSTLTYVNAS